MLKEGWDVTNLYTIVPPAPANARTLIEQSIGRGLRLPLRQAHGRGSSGSPEHRAHDKFQEIIDEANRGDSPIRLKQVILDAPSADDKKVSVQVELRRDGAVWGLRTHRSVIQGLQRWGGTGRRPAPTFTTRRERRPRAW